MNSAEIYHALKSDHCTSKRFRGVFARDEFHPSKELMPGTFVVNTHDSDKPGEHWTAFYFNSLDDAEFFDSYGNEPETYFSFRRPRRLLINKLCVQSDFSSCCGQFCIYYLTLRSRGMDMKQIKGCFDTQLKQFNDAVVTKFVNKHFNLKTSVLDYPFVVQHCLNKLHL